MSGKPLQAVLIISLVLSALAQNQPPPAPPPPPQGYLPQDTYPDSAPDSLIPSIPWPEWLPSDLSSIPGNLPRSVQWQPPAPPPAQGTGNNAPQGQAGVLEIISKLFGGSAAPAPGGYNNMGPPLAPGGGPQPARSSLQMRRYPKGDPRNCFRDDNDSVNIMQVVPGIGWDNLRNIETGKVTSFSYSQCRVTYDRKYLIPDETFAIPVKTSIVERNSEYIEHWDTYKSVTSRSINSGFDFFGKIGGKFSDEFLDIKSSMYNEKAISMRMELRHRFYSIKQLPDSKLHPSFKNRLLDIMSLLKSNDSRSADYATQLLIRDYGTHFLTSVDAGAILVQQDNLKSTIKSSYKGRSNAITAAGGLQFFNFLNVGGGYASSSSTADLTAYRSHLTSSKVKTFGGPPFRLGMNITEWEKDLPNNLVAVDRIGRPLHSVITSENMKPEVMSTAEIIELKNLVQDVASRYYDFNTHRGCTDVNAPNFDYQANSPDPGDCRALARNYTFGGVFQTCSYISHSNGMCASLVQKNPITGSYRCPSGYDAILLLSSTASRPKTEKTCELVKKCAFWIFKCRHENKCQYFQSTEKVRHQTFWCAPKPKKQSPRTGYLFGGIYSKDMNNPITRARNCPDHYIAMKFSTHAHICLTEDYELGQQFALPFGGFFSCRAGNKLAVTNASEFMNNPHSWPMQCPAGFTQHLALTDNNCRVNFCVKAGTLLRAVDLDIVLPPFEPRPGLKQNSTMDLFDGVDPNAFGQELLNLLLYADNTTFFGSSPLYSDAGSSNKERSVYYGGQSPFVLAVMTLFAAGWQAMI